MKDNSNYSIAYVNSKGGVGKSTLCMLSAIAIMKSKKNFSVKLIDTDNQKSSLSILNHINNEIVLEYVPFNYNSPGLGASLLDQKLKSISSQKQITLIDTMAHPPRQLINCLMQCNAIVVPCSLSDIEILASIEFIKWLDGLKQINPGHSPHLILLPNRVPPNQRYIHLLTDKMKDIDVIIGPTISELALLRNDLKFLPNEFNKLPNRFQIEFKNLMNFLNNALIGRGIDKILESNSTDELDHDSSKNNIVEIPFQR